MSRTNQLRMIEVHGLIKRTERRVAWLVRLCVIIILMQLTGLVTFIKLMGP